MYSRGRIHVCLLGFLGWWYLGYCPYILFGWPNFVKRFTDCLVLFSEVEESCTTWSILSLSRISVSCMLYGEMLVPVCVDVFVFISTAQLPCESFMWYCWEYIGLSFLWYMGHCNYSFWLVCIEQSKKEDFDFKF